MRVQQVNNDYYNRSNSVAFKQILRNDIPAKAIKDNKYLLLVSGPSGVGKDTIMNEVMQCFNKLVTHTTRPKREGEIEGVNYFYTTVEKFIEGIKNNEFVEYVNSFSGKYYGTKRETIKNALTGEKPVLAIIDTEGVKNIKKSLKDDPSINVVSIFFQPPSLEVLKSRLLGRGTETAAAIQERLGKAEYEMAQAKNYDAEIRVDNVQDSIKDLKELLHIV